MFFLLKRTTIIILFLCKKKIILGYGTKNSSFYILFYYIEKNVFIPLEEKNILYDIIGLIKKKNILIQNKNGLIYRGS